MMARAPWRFWCVLAALQASAALAWTEPEVISDPAINLQWPRITRSASGGMHTIQRYWFRPWKIAYRYRDSSGNWTPLEYPSPYPFQDTPCVVEDPQGRVHIFYSGGPSGNWPEEWVQVYDMSKAPGGGWTHTQATPTESQHHGYPRAAIDSQGRIHLTYLRVNLNSSVRADVYYRMWNGTSWSSDTWLGRVDNFYYHHGQIVCDSADNVHAVWVDRGGSRLQVIYRRLSGGVWSAAIPVGGSVTQNWITFPKIIATSPAHILIAANDDGDQGTPVIKATRSTTGGATWSPFDVVTTGSYASIEPGAGGSAHLVYSMLGEKALGYRTWDGVSWSKQLRITQPTNWQMMPDIARDTNGLLHLVYDSQAGTAPHVIAYSNAALDGSPPAPPSNFVAVAQHNKVVLSWKNPMDGDFNGTIVRFRTDAYPTSPTDGTLLCDRTTNPDIGDFFNHTGVTNGTTYYYAAFSYDEGPQYSIATTAVATPFVPPDIDRDGDVDQSDFGRLQTCLSGPLDPVPSGCGAADFDVSGNVNSSDLNALLACFSGADVPYVPTCAD